MSGSIQASLDGAQLDGFSLGSLRQVAGLHTRLARGAADAALTQGQSPGLSGTLNATLAHGRLTVAPSALASADGTVSLSGTAWAADGAVALILGLDAGPGGVAAAELGLDGDWHSGAVTRRRSAVFDRKRQRLLPH